MQLNFVCLIEETVRRFAGKAAVAWDGGELTYAELEQRAAGFAESLDATGVKQGDRVALLLSNHWSFVVALWGALKLGVTVAPLTTLLKEEEQERILRDLEPVQTIQSVPFLTRPHETRREVNSPALIAYSSGSTGKPKGAVISHSALTFANQSWAAMMGVIPDDVVLAVLPLPHAFGLHGALLAPLISGATVVIMERFSVERVLATIEARGITLFPGVATMFRRILSSSLLQQADLSSLRLCISGAAPCPWQLARQWRLRTGKRILRGYGMTELFRPISYLFNEEQDYPESIGKPVPGVEARIVGENGESLVAGEVGELWIRSPAALDGYWKDPEETRTTLVNGWFRTGDLARMSPDSFVTIVGRVRERILRGGYSVFPQEVEAILLSHPAVAETAVVGIPNPDLGEEVAAFVVLTKDRKVTANDLIEYCKARMAGYKYPREVYFLAELPKGPTGKVIKDELKAGQEHGMTASK